MSIKSGLANEGALYELIARGNKDVYFFNDDFTSVNPFDNRYKQIPAQVHELRHIPPLNSAEFGRTSEFEFEVAGEIFTDPTLVIDLPSWLPPEIASQNLTAQIKDLSGTAYGYTNAIAYFLFKNIQIYQDQILLQEFSGDSLFITSRSRGSLSQAFLNNAITGIHDGSYRSIQKSATPGRLRLHLPMLGCQHADDGGFLSICARAQTYKLRITLRRLEELVEASDAHAYPMPWGRSDFLVNGTPCQTLERAKIGTPNIQLETRHIYVDHETRAAISRTQFTIPFQRLYENTFTFGPKDYEPLKRLAAAVATRRLDAVHPASRIVFWFHSQTDLAANRYTHAIQPSGGEYYNNISLLIAGRDRETLFPPLVYNKLQNLAKEDRDPGAGIGTMSWDLGDLRGRRAPFARQPEGTVNFSSADRPTLYVDLAATPSQNTELRAVVDTWALFVFEDGRGQLKYAN